MKLIALKCPNCGADINLDAETNMDFGFCQYCGTKVLKDIKEIRVSGTVKGNVNIDNEVTVKGVVTPENLVIKAKRQFKNYKLEDAKKTLERVFELDPYNEDALNLLKQIKDKKNEIEVSVALLVLLIIFILSVLPTLINS